jgi:hypothetical protein
MVTYCLTNTKCVQTDSDERPRTAIQWLAAPFPSHGNGSLGVEVLLKPATTLCVKESAKRASRRESEPQGEQERLLRLPERSSRPLRGASKDEVVGVIFLRAILLKRAALGGALPPPRERRAISQTEFRYRLLKIEVLPQRCPSGFRTLERAMMGRRGFRARSLSPSVLPTKAPS